VAAARKLRLAKQRAVARAFLVEGPHAVGEALTSGRHRVRELFITPAAADREVDLLRRAAAGDVPVTLVDDRTLASISETVTPQGVVGVVGMGEATLDVVAAARPRLVAVLCGVADPGNAGAVIRTADAAGADAVVLTAGSVDVYNGKCVRAGAGSLFHLPVVTTVAPRDAVDALRTAHLQIVAATLDGPDDLDEVADAGGLAGATAWLFGSEAHGLDDDVTRLADRRVRVPIHGHAESLNLAAAAAVCLYASARAQRR